MLDWEVSDGVSGSTAAANAQAFINEVQARTGKQTVIYTAPGLWSGFGVPQSFGSDSLWVADYMGCTPSGSCCPAMPSGWSSFVAWQWSIDGRGARHLGPRGRRHLQRRRRRARGLRRRRGVHLALGHGVGHGGPVSGAPCGGGVPQPTAPSACGSIPSGEGLNPGQSVASCDGRFVLVMQTDGNLVLYAHGLALWSSGTAGSSGAAVVMQGDGNLVIYDTGGCPIWASNTGGNSGASLAVQDDGNVVIYGSGPLWSSGSGPIASPPSGCGTIPSGAGLGRFSTRSRRAAAASR